MELEKKTSDPIQWTPYLIGKCIIRAIYVLVNNLYCIPAYMVWMCCIFPLRFFRPDTYWYIEGVLFKWLLAMVTCWMTTAGYNVIEVGEDVSPANNDETLVIINHQSTGDVPTIMHALQHKGKVVRHMMWIQDLIFKYTNFGVVSACHGDFFIQQGKEYRNTMLDKLQDHIEKIYLTRDRKWILLFPEGGFLRKRRQRSQIFGQKNNFPILEHVTLPRVGAMKKVLTTLSKETLQRKSSQIPGEAMKHIKWVIDITVGYPDGKPLDLQTVIAGQRPPCDVTLYYRLYPISIIPTDTEGLTGWMYRRYEEKEQLLDTFYITGMFPDLPNTGSIGKRLPKPIPIKFSSFYFLSIHLFFILSTYVQWSFFLGIYSAIF